MAEGNFYSKLFKENYSERISESVNSFMKRIEEKLEETEDPVESTRCIQGIELMLRELSNGTILDSYLEGGEKAKPKLEVTYGGHYTSLGDVLKDFREQLDLPTHKLSDLCGVSVTTINRLENNKAPKSRKLRGDSRERLLNVFNINPVEKIEDLKDIPDYS